MPSGGTILSANAADTNLTTAGYVKLGKVGFLEWEHEADVGSGIGVGLTAVWTGSEMILYGGGNLSSSFNDTWSYTPGKAMYLYLRP